MTIQEHSRTDSPLLPSRTAAQALLRAALAGLLGVAAAVLVSCGGSGAGLIPAGNAGPLQGDFETIAQAAQSGNGSCAATEAAIVKTERDFRSLPGNVDGGLRNTLRQGIGNLRSRALVLCSQPLQQPTAPTQTTKTTPTTSSTTSTTPPPATTPTQTQPAPTTTTPPPTGTGPGGGTKAPEGGGPVPGGTEPGANPGGQEGGK
jgi:hypothetical protein